MKSLVLVVCLLGLLLNSFVSAQSALPFVVNPTNVTGPWDHYWERCIGSGHALLGLRADYQRFLTQVHDELGIQSVRFHAIFDDDMSTVLGTDPLQTSFFNIDAVYDFLVSIGMKPYVELSFMPQDLASGNTTVFHYKANTSPPQNLTQWAEFIGVFVTHLISRYGVEEIRTWNFEVWNEPNLPFWAGTQAEYFAFYNYTANAIKNVDKLIPVGGPATAQSAWIPEFLEFVEQNNVPIDFVSTHEYPTDVYNITRDTMRWITSHTRSVVPENLPLYYSEYNDGLYYTPPYHCTPFASSYIIKTIHDVAPYPDILSWWTFSDIFEEDGFTSVPFNLPWNWGLLNNNGIAKPSYRAFQLLHWSGDSLVETTPDVNYYPTIGAYSVVGNGSLMIFVSNFDLPETNYTTQTVSLTITNAEEFSNEGYLYRIDHQNCNPAQTWIEMGSPTYPTPDQIRQLNLSSQFNVENLTSQRSKNGELSFEFDVPPQGVAVLQITQTSF